MLKENLHEIGELMEKSSMFKNRAIEIIKRMSRVSRFFDIGAIIFETIGFEELVIRDGVLFDPRPCGLVELSKTKRTMRYHDEHIDYFIRKIRYGKSNNPDNTPLAFYFILDMNGEKCTVLSYMCE